MTRPRAATAFRVVIDSGHANMAPQAAVDLGVLRKEQGDPAGASTAYQLAVHSWHSDMAPAAA